MPTYTLHHLVKERYPRFVDALSDLDDALTLTYLFAALPVQASSGLKAKDIIKAKKTAAAWGAYCATTSTIAKSFISVKGVFMEAEIQGVEIRWIIPHSFTQFIPDDVDFRIMSTFFEFYDIMLNFVLFKLYNDIGIRFPFSVKDLGSDVIGSTSSLLGSNLRALTNALDSANAGANVTNLLNESVQKSLDENKKDQNGVDNAKHSNVNKRKNKELVESVGDALNKLRHDGNEGESEKDDEDEENDDVDISGPLQATFDSMKEERLPGGMVLDDESLKRKRLFQGLTFFLSREVPRGYLELVCLAYGAKVGWEGDDSPISMKDSSITHHIVDRPNLPASYDSLPKSREYIQPQWILDCANFVILLPVARYAVGASLPPHLSPWVDNEEEGYKPKYAEEIERLKNGEPMELERGHRDAEVEPTEDVDGPDNEIDEEVEEKANTEQSDEDNDEEVEEEADDEDNEENDRLDERKERKRKQDEEEEHRLAKSMMNRKAAHLYGRMQHGIAKKKAKVDALHQRRQELDAKEKEIKGKEKSSDGKTVQKQKVERLKNERKTVEKTYSNTGGTMKKSKKRRVTK
jgi:pescadillo protein